ncbi:hypothetical protein SBC1_28750 [Caballeronia sp. SBC1]|nr:hypothetical protein SBC1_28750 [Caballeronia sp. SBC1]
MRYKNKRVLWLLNHKTLMPYEAKLLVELGYEVFTPKVIPTATGFRSGAVDFSYDKTLSIPKRVLARLNSFNFYETAWPSDIVKLLNRYFGAIYIIPYGKQVPEALAKFEGTIMFRAFGLDNTQTYTNVLQLMYGPEILGRIAELGEKFVFAQGYDQLMECEPPLISDRALFLPIGVPQSFWSTENTYTGRDKCILFVCPNCVTNPYYSAVYRKFKEEFGDLPHVIFGAQDVPVDDPHVLGFVSDAELIRLYQDCALLYYHSTELRHVHYSPIEAAINGMPVVYFEDSLLGRMTPEIAGGRCVTAQDARACVEQILSGNQDFIEQVRNDQRALAFKFSDEYCKDVWQKNLTAAGLLPARRAEAIRTAVVREAKRTVLRPWAKGLVTLPRKTPVRQPTQEQVTDASVDVTDKTSVYEGIDFSKPLYPSFVQGVTGLSFEEEGGRWSVGSTVAIALARPLPKRFKLLIEGGGYGPNIGMPVKIRIGRTKREMTFWNEPGMGSEIAIEFSMRKPRDLIEITIPKPTFPPGDNRDIGVAFRHLKIEAMEVARR